MTQRPHAALRDPPPAVRGRTGIAVHASRTEVARRAARGALLALAAAGLLAVSGAFGSGGISAPVRVVYWLVVMAGGWLAGAGVSELFVQRGWMDGPFWRVAALLTLAVSAPVLLIVWTVSEALFAGRTPRVQALPNYLPAVVIISAVLTLLNLLLGRPAVVTHAAEAGPREGAPPTPAPVRFLERLPPKLRGAELHAVEAEDHYLRLHTSRGSDLILLRLADALAELDGIEGAQTHRSWWVARDAVAEVRRGDGRATLVLKDGVQAPVSRTYAPALREGGWF